MFITFEGLDFCGKSTQVKLLEQKYKENNITPITLREPGGTEISEQVREILLDNKNHKMSMESELLLFSSSRAQLIREIIIPALAENKVVISDRFHDSTTAYQGYGRGVDKEFIKKLNNFVISNAIPDLTFFIDLPIEEILIRKKNIKHLELDRIENSEIDFYQRVRKGYLELSKNEKRFIKLDGSKSIEEINFEIITTLNQKNSGIKNV